MPTAIFNLCFPAWANYHCVRGSHLFMSPFPDTLKIWVAGCHWVSSLGITDHQLVAADLSLMPLMCSLVRLCCAHTAGHCKTDEASPWCRGRACPPDAGISRPQHQLCAGWPGPPLPTRLRLPIYSCEGLGPPTYKFRPATNYSEVDSVRFPAGD